MVLLAVHSDLETVGARALPLVIRQLARAAMHVERDPAGELFHARGQFAHERFQVRLRELGCHPVLTTSIGAASARRGPPRGCRCWTKPDSTRAARRDSFAKPRARR